MDPVQDLLMTNCGRVLRVQLAHRGIGHIAHKETEMNVRFYNRRRRVYTVSANTIGGAIELMESTGIEWTRYKIY